MTRLESQEVLLRLLERRDAELVVAWRSRPEVASQLFGAPPTMAEHVRWTEQMLAGGDREEYVICWRQYNDRPVGTVGLSSITARHRRAEYGILLGDPDARGHGLAQEASGLVLRRAFEALGLERVFLHTYADNAPAVALYQRLGFVREGVLREHARREHDPVRRDVLVMGLLAREWAARKAYD